MSDKKTILVCAPVSQLDGGDACKKFLKKSAVINNFSGAGAYELASRVEGVQAVSLDELGQALEGGAAFVLVEHSDASDPENLCAKVLEAADRRTLVVLAGEGKAWFAGLGIKRGADPGRSAAAADIVPTICYVADLPVPEDTEGAVIYQVLKDPDMKAKEIGKLQEAIARMEAALSRGSHDPWDKHDCA